MKRGTKTIVPTLGSSLVGRYRGLLSGSDLSVSFGGEIEPPSTGVRDGRFRENRIFVPKAPRNMIYIYRTNWGLRVLLIATGANGLLVGEAIRESPYPTVLCSSQRAHRYIRCIHKEVSLMLEVETS